jgi:signal transduction histidine kinase
MMSLSARLIRTLTIMLVLVFLGQWVLLSVAIRKVSQEQMLVHLEHDSDALLVALSVDEAQRLRLDEQVVEPVYQEPHSGHYYLVRAAGGEAHASPSLGDFPIDARPIASAGRTDYRTDGPRGQSLLVLARTEAVAGRAVSVYVAEDMSGTNREIWRLSLMSLAVFLPMLAAAMWLQRVAVRRALLPLVSVRDQLREVGAGKHARITGAVPAEIKPLVDELNRLLVLLQRRLTQSRTALGNLAHALKTPLAVLARSAEDPAMPAQWQAVVSTQAGAIGERVERELRRARLAGTSGVGAGAYFNPAAELPVLTRVLGGIYRDKALGFQLSAPDALLPFDREDMLELIGNLADNACKWARSQVAVSVAGPETDADGGLRLTVADDGPGCAPEHLDKILDHGVRLDEAMPGHGLGLSITRDIVDAYGGRMAIDRDPTLGGLRIEIVLPMPVAGGDSD